MVQQSTETMTVTNNSRLKKCKLKLIFTLLIEIGNLPLCYKIKCDLFKLSENVWVLKSFFRLNVTTNKSTNLSIFQFGPWRCDAQWPCWMLLHRQVEARPSRIRVERSKDQKQRKTHLSLSFIVYTNIF